MNRSWLTLMIMGIVFLIAAVAWEAYQNFSGARSNIDISIVEYQRDSLFSPRLEQHLSSDPKFITQNTTNTIIENTVPEDTSTQSP